MTRVNHLDIAKAIGIVLVVLGHTKFAEISYIYAFHMPLFFLITGYLFGYKKELPKLNNFIKYRFNRLMIPYFTACLFFYAFWLIIGKKFGEKATLDINPIHPLLGIFWGNGNADWLIFNIPLWFLPALFCAEIIFVAILKYVQNVGTVKSWCIISLVSLTGFVISKVIFLPWGFDIAIVAQLFIYAGYMLNKNKFFERNLFIVQLLMPFLVVIVYVVGQANDKVDMNNRAYRNILLFYIGGLSGSFVVFYFTQLLERLKISSSILQKTGKETLQIMIFHSFAFKILSAIGVLVLHKPLDLMQSFWYMYTIWGLIISYAIGKVIQRMHVFAERIVAKTDFKRL